MIFAGDLHSYLYNLTLYPPKANGSFFSKSVNTNSLPVYNIIYNLKATGQLIPKLTSAAIKDVAILREIYLKLTKTKNFKNVPTT